jgi:hypothetical protein
MSRQGSIVHTFPDIVWVYVGHERLLYIKATSPIRMRAPESEPSLVATEQTWKAKILEHRLNIFVLGGGDPGLI